MNKLTPTELRIFLGALTTKTFLAQCEAMRIEAGQDSGDNLVAIWATKLTGIACEAFDITGTIEASYSRDSFEPIVMPQWMSELLLDSIKEDLPELASSLVGARYGFTRLSLGYRPMGVPC